jgi:chromosome partitioning protein
MRVVIANLKGGVGKTTTSVHLATGLGRQSETLLIDADPQGSATRWSELAADLPYRTIPHARPDLDRRFGRLLDGEEHVVIDTPPGQEAIVRSAISLAEMIIVPVEPLLMDLDHLGATMKLIASTTVMNRPAVHILLTRVRSGTRSARSTPELLRSTRLPILKTQIPMMEAYGWGYGRIPPEGHYYGQLLEELMGASRKPLHAFARALKDMVVPAWPSLALPPFEPQPSRLAVS